MKQPSEGDVSSSDDLEDEIMRLSITEVRSELAESGIELTSSEDLVSYGIISENISASIEDQLEREILSLKYDDVRQQLFHTGFSPCTDDELENIFIETIFHEPDEIPLSGIEKTIAVGSDAVVAVRGGVVDSVAAGRIVVRTNDYKFRQSETGLDIYPFFKQTLSNQKTYTNHRPLVRAGSVIARGDVLTDVTNMHIKELFCVVRSTKQGIEEISADIPNVSESMLSMLNESGIVHAGAEVKPGDILVGKGYSENTRRQIVARDIRRKSI